jgi:NAD(P)-dependent dehydrogenase (short-subunit alcohol dehydrogenase family)
MKFSIDEVSETLHRLFIGVDGAGLRREDQKKASELVAFLSEVARVATKPTGTLVDLAAGKSPVGLVALLMVLPPAWRVVVVDRAADRAAAAVAAAARAGVADRVDVVVADVADVKDSVAAADVVTALHACGGASDAIIDVVAAAAPTHLLLVPCCYGAHPKNADAETTAIPGQRLTGPLASMLPRQGVVGRRVAASLIDVERTLRLEAAGYDTAVVEFTAPTVTPFNLVWRARRGLDERRRAEARQRLADFSNLLHAGAAAQQTVYR